MNIDRLRVLVEDLDYLEASWNAQIIPDSTLRRDSAILRRLLVDLDRVLATAWRELGFTKGPKIVAPDLDRLLGLRGCLRP